MTRHSIESSVTGRIGFGKPNWPKWKTAVGEIFLDKKDKTFRAPNEKRPAPYSPSRVEDRTVADNTAERFGPEHPEYQRNRARK